MSDGEPKSPWFYLAWGCGGCLVLAGLALGVTIWFGYRMARDFERQMEDPMARTEKAEKVLGTQQLPEDYQAVITFSLPLVFDMVILADQPLDEDRELSDSTEKLFVFVEVIRGDRNWQRYTTGRADPADVLRDQGVRFDTRDEISQGALGIDGGEIDYFSRRGRLDVDHGGIDGITTFLLVRCEGDKRMRVGVWTHRDPAPDTPVAEADFSGTNADPEVIRSFVSHFSFCSG